MTARVPLALCLVAGFLCGCTEQSASDGDSDSGLPTASVTPPGTPSSAAAAPITETDRKRWEEAFARSLRKQDRRELDALVDWETLTRSALKGLPASPDFRKEFVVQVVTPLRRVGLMEDLCLAAGRGDRYRFVSASDRKVVSGSNESLARFASQDGKSLDFHGWVLSRNAARAVTASDLFSYSGGEFLSRSLRRSALRLLAARRPGETASLSAWDRAFLAHQKSIAELLAAGEAKDVPRTVRAYKALPPELRADRTLAFVYLAAVAKGERFVALSSAVTSGDLARSYDLYDMLPESLPKTPASVTTYAQAITALRLPGFVTQVERLREATKYPEQIDFLSLDGLMTLGDSQPLLACLNRLAERFGADAQLLSMQARVLLDDGHSREARTQATAALQLEPDWLAAYWVLVDASLSDGQHAETAHWLSELRRRSPESVLNLGSLPEFGPFLASEPGRPWRQ